MHSLITIFTCLILIFASYPMEGLADEIEDLTLVIQYKQPREIREIIGQKLGNDSRHIGSGFDIEQWDISGGVLTYHPMAGVFFVKDGISRRLMQTSNSVGECLFGSYEMYSLEIPEKHGRKWIGNLSISKDLRYKFKPSGQFPEEQERQKNNFFFLNPEGSARIVYSDGVTKESLLEKLPDDERVATIELKGDDNKSTTTFFIVSVSRQAAMVLKFDAELPLSFHMNKGWSTTGTTKKNAQVIDHKKFQRQDDARSFPADETLCPLCSLWFTLS